MRIAMDAEGKEEKKRRLENELRYFEKKGKKKKRKYSQEVAKEMIASSKLDFMHDDYYRQLHFQLLHYRMNFIGMLERNTYEERIVEGDVKRVLVRRGKIALAKIGRHGSDVTEENALPILKKHIKSCAHIMSDKHLAYANLNKHFRKHSTIKHTAAKNISVKYVEKDEETGLLIHTNSIENSWNQLKKVENGVYVHFSYEYASHYLNEFVFRWNHMDETTNEKLHVLLGRSIEMTISQAELMEKDDGYFYIAK